MSSPRPVVTGASGLVVTGYEAACSAAKSAGRSTAPAFRFARVATARRQEVRVRIHLRGVGGLDETVEHRCGVCPARALGAKVVPAPDHRTAQPALSRVV